MSVLKNIGKVGIIISGISLLPCFFIGVVTFIFNDTGSQKQALIAETIFIAPVVTALFSAELIHISNKDT